MDRHSAQNSEEEEYEGHTHTWIRHRGDDRWFCGSIHCFAEADVLYHSTDDTKVLTPEEINEQARKSRDRAEQAAERAKQSKASPTPDPQNEEAFVAMIQGRTRMSQSDEIWNTRRRRYGKSGVRKEGA